MKELKPLLDSVDVSRIARRMRNEDKDYFYTLKKVSISKINLTPAWSLLRLQDNLNKIKKTHAMPPIFLYNRKDGRYDIEDGIHRTTAAKMLGYSYVWAIVAHER